MRKIQPNERDFQTWVKAEFKKSQSFFSQVHPGLSADSGLPDLLFLSDYQGLVPVELKIGHVDAEGFVHTSQIRPSQIRWHSQLNRAGGCSIILVGVWCGDRWQAIAVDALYIDKAEGGFEIGLECDWLDSESLANSLNDFVNESADMAV